MNSQPALVRRGGWASKAVGIDSEIMLVCVSTHQCLRVWTQLCSCLVTELSWTALVMTKAVPGRGLGGHMHTTAGDPGPKTPVWSNFCRYFLLKSQNKWSVSYLPLFVVVAVISCLLYLLFFCLFVVICMLVLFLCFFTCCFAYICGNLSFSLCSLSFSHLMFL